MALRRFISRPLGAAVVAITAALLIFGAQSVWSQNAQQNADARQNAEVKAPKRPTVQLPRFQDIQPGLTRKPLERAPAPFERFPPVRVKETTAGRAIRTLFGGDGTGRESSAPPQIAVGPRPANPTTQRAIFSGEGLRWPVQQVNRSAAGPERGSPSGPLSPVTIAASQRTVMQDPIEINAPRPQNPLPAPATTPADPAEANSNEPRVTMHMADVDVRQAFEMFSRTHALNILVAPDVETTVTANFVDVPLSEAISAVLTLCKLTAHREKGMLFIYAADSYPKSELQIRTFPLNYISSDDLLTTISSLLSESGQAFTSKIDSQNNRKTQEVLIVTDTPASLQRIEQLVAEMDQPPRQVLIEAHVLEVELSMADRHGVNYKHLIGTEFKLDMAGLANPMASPAMFASIQGSQVDALIEWLRTTTEAKTLASPRVMVVNGQKARIQVGEQLGFKVVTVTETASVEEVKFLEVGVVLEVTANVTNDNRVMMRVKPEVSSGAINPDTLLPEEETRELETDVLLNDGQGVVIGGLIQERDSNVQKKVPFFGDIWLLGKFFQRRELIKERSEIVVTLVPRVVDNELPVSDRDVMCVEQTAAPLFYGPLQRNAQPILPDTIYNPVPIGPFGRSK